MSKRIFSPEQQTRSGTKQSNEEYLARKKKPHHQNGGGEDPRLGIKLHRAVSVRLTQLGIEHEGYGNKHPVARAERIEFLIDTGRRRCPFIKVQHTLRHGTKPKIFDFILAAITGEDTDVPRVYLEIDAPRNMQAKDLAERVAYSIQKIVRQICDLPREIGNVIGFTLDATSRNWRDSLSRISLLGMLEDAARSAIVGIYHGMNAARHAATLVKIATNRAGPIHRIIGATLRECHGFRAHPVPAFATSQVSHPLRMPFRR